MPEKMVKKKAPGRGEVEVLGETFEEGKPEDKDLGRWEQKLATRQDKLKYLETAERYWYSKEGFGSEKRKNPA
ncbi:MAG: hypothetical protein ABIH70_06330 [Chloroflexota bacterium]